MASVVSERTHSYASLPQKKRANYGQLILTTLEPLRFSELGFRLHSRHVHHPRSMPGESEASELGASIAARIG